MNNEIMVTVVCRNGVVSMFGCSRFDVEPIIRTDEENDRDYIHSFIGNFLSASWRDGYRPFNNISRIVVDTCVVFDESINLKQCADFLGISAD